MPPIRKPPTPQEARRGMLMLQAFFTSYFAIGFAYPIIYGENVLHTLSKKYGLIDEKQYHKEVCEG